MQCVLTFFKKEHVVDHYHIWPYRKIICGSWVIGRVKIEGSCGKPKLTSVTLTLRHLAQRIQRWCLWSAMVVAVVASTVGSCNMCIVALGNTSKQSTTSTERTPDNSRGKQINILPCPAAIALYSDPKLVVGCMFQTLYILHCSPQKRSLHRQTPLEVEHHPHHQASNPSVNDSVLLLCCWTGPTKNSSEQTTTFG